MTIWVFCNEGQADVAAKEATGKYGSGNCLQVVMDFELVCSGAKAKHSIGSGYTKVSLESETINEYSIDMLANCMSGDSHTVALIGHADVANIQLYAAVHDAAWHVARLRSSGKQTPSLYR